MNDEQYADWAAQVRADFPESEANRILTQGPRTQTRLQIWRILRRGGMTRWRAFKMATGTFGAKRITYIRDQQERR